MVDRMIKILNKLSKKERLEIERIIELISINQLINLDLKKLKGADSVYRVRKGKIRVIFKKTETSYKIIAIERRSERTYKDW